MFEPKRVMFCWRQGGFAFALLDEGVREERLLVCKFENACG